jgi:hypothetical protein
MHVLTIFYGCRTLHILKVLTYLSRQADIHDAVTEINQKESFDAMKGFISYDADKPEAAEEARDSTATRQQRVAQAATIYRDNFDAAMKCLHELREVLMDTEFGVIKEIRKRFKAACNAQTEPVIGLLNRIAKEEEYKDVAEAAIKAIEKERDGGICYLSDDEVQQAVKSALEGLMAASSANAEDFMPSKLLANLVDNQMIIRSFFDVVMAKNNRVYAQGLQNVVRMVASMQGCANKTLNDLNALGSPVSRQGQFKARMQKQLMIDRICAILKVLAEEPPVVVSAHDNYFRSYVRPTEGAVMYGSWGTMNLTNHIMRVLKHLPLDVFTRISKLIESGKPMYEGVWGDEGKKYLLRVLHEVCILDMEKNTRVFGGDFEASLRTNQHISTEVREFVLNLIGLDACRESLRKLGPAFHRSMMHGTTDQDESLEGLMQRIRHIGLMNIDSNSRAGCLEMLRVLLTHPACKFHISKGRLFILSGDIALVYHWLNGVMSGAYPMDFMKNIVFIPDMFLHPLIKLNKVIWKQFKGIISPLFEAGAARVGKGKFLDSVRLSTSRVWLNLIHEAFQGSDRAKAALASLQLNYPHDPTVIALTMFFGEYVPLAVALSNCMEQAKSDTLEIRHLAFDSLYQVLLPAMAHAFNLLKSHMYRYDLILRIVQLKTHTYIHIQ